MKEHKSRIIWSLFVVSILLVMCAPALAQHASDNLGVTFGTPAGATITKTIMDRIARRNRERRLAARRSGASSTARTSSSASAQPVAKPSEASVRFRPTGTQLKAREIANLIDAGDPQVLKLLTVLLEEFDKGARAAGHPNDLALALSYFFATNASVYHDAGQPTDPPMVELRDAIAEALVEGNALNGVTDRQKQEMYETLVILTGFALATYREGKQAGNADTVKVSRQLAGQNLLALIGISPDKINFTDQGLSIEAEPAASAQSTTEPTSPQSALSDPFPDRPGYAPQKPLSGTLNATITVADLAGTWDHGAGSVQTYVDSNTGDYSRTNTTFYGEQYSIRSDGTFTYKFVGRANNRTVRELDTGNVILSGGFITFKFKARATQKYQFIAFMTQTNGAAILSLVGVHDNFPGYDAAGLSLECGHSEGFMHCVGGEEWARLGAKPAK